MLNIGLIGFGAIGSAVADAIGNGKAGDTKLVTVLVRAASKLTEAGAGHGFDVVTTLPDLLQSGIDLVVEAAGAAALVQYAVPALRAGKDLMPISVGAFADADFWTTVRGAARESHRRILIPSGAIAGLDGIAAASIGSLDEVTHTVRKPPRAFSAAQLGVAALVEPKLLYDGPARAGIHRFPENVNVTAAISLAGVGFDRTRLRVIADPAVSRNIHEVEVSGDFGRMRLTMENLPSENPKTSRITALSIAKALRNLSQNVVVGV
jgi:aspartate dehydrogenase